MMIDDLIKFNDFLDSKIDPKNLDEEFITLRQVELDDISKNFDVKYYPAIALSYAKLMELTVLLAGMYADDCHADGFGNIVVNPRHIDICILNTRLIQEEYGITDCLPLWFKKHVRACIGSQYAEDLGRMVVDPTVLFRFVEQGLLLRVVKKERHGRLSDQFRGCISGNDQSAFSQYAEEFDTSVDNSGNGLGCGGGREGCPDIASWLASSTVLNVVKDTVKSDLMNVLRETMSDAYLSSIDTKFEKALNSLNYVSIGRKSFADFPYAEVPIVEWAEINHNLCHFTLDGYGLIQTEFDKSLSNPCYQSPFLKRVLYNIPKHRTQPVHQWS